jgi:hypothetical protein
MAPMTDDASDKAGPGRQTPGPNTPGPNTPGPNTPGPDTPGPNTPRPDTAGDDATARRVPRARAGGACPICGKPSDAKARPFCSRRCADLDLARWLGGSYRVPTSEPPGPEDLEDE